ncbi:copper homeostasis protein CutC, partial [Robertmurraya sp. DFI.2.37]|uniref:copper homeostasis protein CutC n=1 Tax=Robertmurraya sp. DFI.2.37 TaxID=3031819 RepID=UPI0023DB763E
LKFFAQRVLKGAHYENNDDYLYIMIKQKYKTHGGSAASKIEDNITRIQEYIDYAANRIIILPSGGITNDNLRAIAAELSINEVHGTRIVG